MLCVLCKGSGNLLTFKPQKRWWECPACGGVGVTVQHGPAKILCRNFNTVVKNKKSKKKT